jgi:hypothetical protein
MMRQGQPAEEPAMSKGEQRSNREKKKPKKDKGAGGKHTSAYASEYGKQQPITINPSPGKKQ